MARSEAPRYRISIRVKLLLVAATLLIIPWVGSRYIQEMEGYLRQQQEDSLLTRTQMVAAVLQGHPELFKTRGATPLPTRGIEHLFIRPLDSPIQLDGYLDDWAPYRERLTISSAPLASTCTPPSRYATIASCTARQTVCGLTRATTC